MRRLLGNGPEGGTDYTILERARQQELKCFAPKKRSRTRDRDPRGFVSDRSEGPATSYRMYSPVPSPQTSHSYEPRYETLIRKRTPTSDFYDEGLGSDMGQSRKSGKSTRSGRSVRSVDSARTGRSRASRGANRRVMWAIDE